MRTSSWTTRLFSICLAATALNAGLARPAAAQLAARSAEEWIKTLEAPARIAGLKIPETIAALKIKPGEVVADLGAGSGAFTTFLATAVRPGGKVYAVDVDEDLLHFIEEKAIETGLGTYVQTVYGDYADPLLPAPVDLAFINDVLHHIEQRAAYLKALAGYMKPTGRIALIDFHPEKGGHRNDPALQIAKDQAHALLAEAGYKPIEEVPLFDDKYFVIYGRK
jgi:ubiquinone/menaquinone biosynthesis C-methylase UbiE